MKDPLRIFAFILGVVIVSLLVIENPLKDVLQTREEIRDTIPGYAVVDAVKWQGGKEQWEIIYGKMIGEDFYFNRSYADSVGLVRMRGEFILCFIKENIDQ